MEREFSALIGANLRRARQTLRLSQTAVAAVLGLSRQAISAAESGKRSITVDELYKAANLYRHSVEWFLKPALVNTAHDFEHVQRRDNARPSRMLDEHDALELQMFSAMLEAAAGSVETLIQPLIDVRSLVDIESSPFRNLSTLAEGVRTKTDVRSPPINVYRALSCLGIRVRMTSLNTISGAYIPGTDRRLPGVLINSNQLSDRQRFSAAHELGHCVLRHDDSGTEEIVSPLGRRFESKEVEADSFASEFLMPAALLAEEAERLPRADAFDAQVYRLADRFLVSYQAMVYRLGNLSAITADQKEELLKLRPSDIEKRLELSREGQRRFDPAVLRTICASTFPESILRDADGVRQLQEVAYEEYARAVAEPERSDPAGAVYEKVAVWVAENYPIAV